MKAGDEIKCPHCRAESFLVKKAVMDGWTKTGDILVCSACTKKVADVPKPSDGGPVASRPDTSRLAALLGGEKAEAKPRLVAGKGERRFCRDCRHLVKHPFLTRCDLHQKDVNPMSDCPDYRPRDQESAEE